MMTFYYPKIAKISLLSVAMLTTLSACFAPQQKPVPQQPVYQPPMPQVQAAPSFSGPSLQPDGTCSEQVSSTATAIDVGIGECDLVRLKGKAPTDVLIGESGRGGRETQVLYAEPTGRELYFFINNKLDRIVK